MPSTVTITGEAELAAKIKKIGGIVRKAALQAVQDETLEVAQDMRRNAPRLTGKLVDGIQAEIDAGALEGQAVSTADYSTYVVHGTSDTAPNDYMTPAAERSRRRFPKRVKNAVAAELEKML
jgi:HK97 gp10 family phage protein